MSESRYRVRLLRWSESSSGGRTVTFQLPDDGDEHPFKGMPTGKRDGAVFEIVVRSASDPDAPLETLASRVGKPEASPAPGPRSRTRTAHPDRTAASLNGGSASPEPRAATDDRAADDGVAPAVSSDTAGNGRATLQALLRAATAEQKTTPAEAPETLGGAIAVGTTAGGGAGSTEAAVDSDLALHAMAQAALDMRRAAVEIAGDRDGGDEEEESGVVERAVTLCKEVDHQRAGFFYYMKARYPTTPELPPEIGQGTWSRDADATRQRVCFHCETQALAELGIDPRAETRFEDLEADYERAERSR